jgi:hypothetical protein
MFTKLGEELVITTLVHVCQSKSARANSPTPPEAEIANYFSASDFASGEGPPKKKKRHSEFFKKQMPLSF